MMRKLTPDYFVKQMIKSKTPTELLTSSSRLCLYWVDYWSYNFRKLLQNGK